LLSLRVSGTILHVKYEWDNGKAAANLHKHGVDFADAIAALEDKNRLEDIDSRFVDKRGADSSDRNGSRQGAVRDRDTSWRGYMQNHFGPEGHTT
jgi:hypothetical protein